MKNILTLIVAVCLLGNLTAQDEITLEGIWKNYEFYPKSVPGFKFMKDGLHFTRKENDKTESKIVQYHLGTGDQTDVILKGSDLNKLNNYFDAKFDGYSFSKDENLILLKSRTEQIYRRSSRADFFVYDRKGKTLTQVSGHGKQRYASFSQKGDKVAFVRGNNLYYKNLKSDDEVVVTSDGRPNEIINGATDWVYEEEFALAKGFQWSPDGKRIAFMRFDETEVKEFTMTIHSGDLYPKYSTFKYPKVGERNAVVSIHIFDLVTGKTIKVETGKETDIYFPRIKWTKDANKLCVFRMNRHQNELDLLLADATTGKTSVLLNEKNKYYIDIDDDLTFLEDGKHFVWTSEKSGNNHIYIHNMKGKQVRQITKGDWDVLKFYGLDEKDGKLFYQSAEVSPLEKHIYSIDIKGKDKQQLTKTAGTNRARFSTTFYYFINTHSATGVPPSYTVNDAKGTLIRSLEDNTKFRGKLQQYGIEGAEFFKFRTSEKVELNGWMIKPPNFDKNKKYPVFMYVYGGPGSQTVTNSWGSTNFIWFNMLAQKGYIVVSVDNRGTGSRGEEFKKMTYLQLGKYETMDQIEAAKYLGGLSYVDKDRIGIFGWSYGGYMSSLCLFKGADVFKMAIAVAPVTSWKWYDTIYTERYMRTEEENPDGYKDNSPVNFAHLMKGKYLLVHGTADDNVHVQNAMEMVNALVRENKQFDSYFYPGRNHGIYGGNTRLHLYKKMTNFIFDNL